SAVVRNPDAQGASPLSSVFLNDFWGRPMADPASHKSYRPLTVLTFRFIGMLLGPSPWWQHATNVALHMLVSLLFCHVLTTCLSLRDNTALIASLLFTVHPIHTEAVTGIVGRAELLAAGAFLLSFLSYHRGMLCNSMHLVYVSAGLASLGMLCKETAITVLGLAMIWDLLYSASTIKRCFSGQTSIRTLISLLKRSSCIIAVSMIVLYLRVLIMNGEPLFSEQDNPASFSPITATRYLTLWYLPALNFWLLLCPSSLAYDWQLGSVPLITSPMDPRNCITAGFYILMLALLLGALKREGNNQCAVVWSVLVMVVSFLPASNLFFRVGFVLAERVLYIPSLGFCTIIGIGIDRLLNIFYKKKKVSKKTKQKQYISLFSKYGAHQIFSDIIISRIVRSIENCVYVMYLSVGNFFNCRIFRLLTKKISAKCTACINCKLSVDYNTYKDLKVYERCITSCSRTKCFNELCKSRKLVHSGISVSKRSMVFRVLSNYKMLRKILSLVFSKVQNLIQSVNYSKKIKAIVFALFAFYSMKTMHRNLDWYNRETLFRSGVTTLPNNAKMHYNYGNLMRDYVKEDQAVHHYRKAIRLWPCYPSAHNNLGVVLLGQGLSDLAEEHFQQALLHHPDHHGAALNLATLWRKLGYTSRAINLLEKFFRLQDVERIKLGLLLVQMYKEQGQMNAVVGMIKDMLSIHPNNPDVQEAFEYY
ncbi:unnamed protein product, partial [Meganyctiphanes norvegica]